MSHLPGINKTDTGLDSGVAKQTGSSIDVEHMSDFTAYVKTASGTIEGLVLCFQCSPDGTNWYDIVEGRHAAVQAGTTSYYFSVSAVVAKQIRLCVDTASAIASTINVDVMGK